MSKEETITVNKIIVSVLVAVLWQLLYFTVLWRLPFTCNLNRVKLPDGCKEIETDVVWSDLEIMHIKAERVFSSPKSREEIEDYINKNNSYLGRIEFGWWSCPEYDHTDAVSPEDHPELPWDGTETYYVLTYSTWGTRIDAVVFLSGGILAALLGILAYYFMGKAFLRKKNSTSPIFLVYEQAVGGKGYSITSLVLGACCILPYIFLVTGFPETPDILEIAIELFVTVLWFFRPVAVVTLIGLTVAGMVFGIMGKIKGGKRIAAAGMLCSFLGFCLAIGIPFVYFLIAD